MTYGPILAAAVVLLARALTRAQPSAPAKPPEQCFWGRDVTGFAPVKGARDRLRITVGLRDVYELTVRGCENADLAFHVALAPTGVSNRICSPLDAELIVPQSGLPPQRCVTAIRPIAAAELAAETAARGSR